MRFTKTNNPMKKQHHRKPALSKDERIADNIRFMQRANGELPSLGNPIPASPQGRENWVNLEHPALVYPLTFVSRERAEEFCKAHALDNPTIRSLYPKEGEK